MIKPILDDAQVREYAGRYRVQLEMPPESTLSLEDIDLVCRAASWSTNPASVAQDYEGGRSIIVRRKEAIVKSGILLDGLQISGIGYTPLDLSRDIAYKGEGFFPPCQENFMDLMTGTKMSTSIADENGGVFKSRPTYRALGTYLAGELKTKLEKTREVSRLELQTMVIPHVEAYGRYLDAELGNAEGQFGFIVFPVKLGKLRATEEVTQTLASSLSTVNLEADLELFDRSAIGVLRRITKSLRELHDTGKLAHLQPHMSNFYLFPDKVYLMDWSTSVSFRDNPEANITNRVIDICRPRQNAHIVASHFFREDVASILSQYSLAEMMQAYTGKPCSGKEIVSFCLRAESVLGHPANDTEALIQSLKDFGLEGFPKYDYEAERKKVDRLVQRRPVEREVIIVAPGDFASQKPSFEMKRNDLCFCGSGKKFKKCCGR